MGQEMSRRHSDDTVTLCSPTVSNSIESLVNDDSRLSNVANGQCAKKRKTKKCGRLSRLKESLLKCFRSNFAHLHETDDNDDEIMSVQQPSTEDFDVAQTLYANDLPRDVHELHNQLATLMRLLSLSDHNGAEFSTRDTSCQTIDDGSNMEQLLRQRDSVILDQQVNLSHLHRELDNKNRNLERYNRELSALKVQQSRYSIENKSISQLLTLFRDVRARKRIEFNDLDKIEEIIIQMSHLSGPMKTHNDNSNVAVVTPCTNMNVDKYTFSSPSINLSSETNFQNSILHPDPDIGSFYIRKDCIDVKLICFLDHSVSPYISSIPLTSSGITLSHIKHYTHSIVPNNAKCRYYFRSMTASSGQTQEELYCDTDVVPVQDNRIVVRIRM